MEKVLVTGACGQIGTDLVMALRNKLGNENVVASGYRTQPSRKMRDCGPLYFIDVRDRKLIEKVLFEHKIDTIFHLASILSAVGETNPNAAYCINMEGLYNILEASKAQEVRQVIWPSSIAAFGPTTPLDNTPDDTVMRPTTMYGLTKVAGELLIEYYALKFGLDTRCVRLPGIISSEALPGGGTTDYAVDAYYKAVERKKYTCFVKPETVLPLLYMPDTINGLINFALVDNSRLKRRVYNIASMSFSAEEQVKSIQQIYPEFIAEYRPDFRQAIADSWPRSLDDSNARKDWGWEPVFDLPKMTSDMIQKLTQKFKETP